MKRRNPNTARNRARRARRNTLPVTIKPINFFGGDFLEQLTQAVTEASKKIVESTATMRAIFAKDDPLAPVIRAAYPPEFADVIIEGRRRYFNDTGE